MKRDMKYNYNMNSFNQSYISIRVNEMLMRVLKQRVFSGHKYSVFTQKN